MFAALLAVVVVTAAVGGWWSSLVAARTSASTYVIMPSAGEHGVITPPVPQVVEAGANVTFTMTPDVGFHVAEVRVDDVSVGAVTSYEFTNVQADHAISVTFARDVEGSFVIVPEAGPHGVITPPIPQTVAAGGSVTFSIAADPSYKVLDVLVDGSSVGAVTSYEFTNVQADHTISATFDVDTQERYVITPSPGAHGQITPPLPQTVVAGGSVIFELVPDEGYQVADVLVDGVSVGPRTTYAFTNVQADHTISATFIKVAVPSFTITPAPGPYGQILPPVPQTLPAGSSITFTMLPDAGYHVADVLIDGSSVGARGTYQFANIQADHTIAATFAEDAGKSVSVSSPLGGESWKVGSVQSILWAMGAAVDSGRFTLWAVPLVGAPLSLGPQVAAEAGRTSYEASCTVSLPAPGGYEILVRYESASGELLSEARSGTVTVTPSTRLSVTSPGGQTAWKRGSTRTVAWKLTQAVVAGEFRAWAVSAAGKRTPIATAGRAVAAKAGRTSYSVRWKVNAKAGRGYRVVVEYWWAGTRLTVGNSAKVLTVKP